MNSNNQLYKISRPECTLMQQAGLHTLKVGGVQNAARVHPSLPVRVCMQTDLPSQVHPHFTPANSSLQVFEPSPSRAISAVASLPCNVSIKGLRIISLLQGAIIISMILCFLTAGLLAQGKVQENIDMILENVKQYYHSGEYHKAIDELEHAKALTAESMVETNMVDAYKYLAFSYVEFGELDKARAIFHKALELNPELDLDAEAGSISPAIIDIFNEIKANFQEPFALKTTSEKFAFLKISVRPWADIYVNERKVATTPIAEPIRVAPREHTIKIVNPNFPIWEENIKFIEADTVEKIIQLKNN